MTRYIKLSAVAAAAMLAAPAFAATDVSANAEYDTGYLNQGRGLSVTSGRIEINVSGKGTNGDYFVAGKGTILAGIGGPGTDDSWVQAGNSIVDAKLGRFEAADMYPTPGDVFRVGGLYQLNNLRGRGLVTPGGGEAVDRFHTAITANVAPGTSIEIGLVEKKNLATGFKGIRPAVSFAAGPVSARVGFESGKTSDPAGGTASFTGFGGWVSAGVADGITLRANLATGKTKLAAGDAKRTAFLFGVDAFGANVSVETGKNTDSAGAETKITGVFAAYAIPLFDVKGATISPALGYQKTKTTVTTNDSRVGFRIHYDF